MKAPSNPLTISRSIFIPDYELQEFGMEKEKLLERIQGIWTNKKEEYHFGTCIKTEYWDMEITKMMYLLEGSLHEKVYRIRGNIFDIAPKRMSEIVRKYCNKCQEQYKITSEFSKCPRCTEDLKNIYFFKFIMKDESLAEETTFFDAYVFTYEESPSPAVRFMGCRDVGS